MTSAERPRPGADRGTGGAAPEFELVLVDGDNLLHRVRGMRDEAGLRWLLPRLRAWRPTNVTITVMLDGHPDPGEAHRRRVATGVEFRHSGDYDGDSAIVATLRARPYAERSRTIVVTDDRQLGDRVRHTGGMVRRLDWLVNGLAASVGEPTPAGGGNPGSRGNTPSRGGPPASGYRADRWHGTRSEAARRDRRRPTASSSAATSPPRTRARNASHGGPAEARPRNAAIRASRPSTARRTAELGQTG